jgi:hypothetical protein
VTANNVSETHSKERGAAVGENVERSTLTTGDRNQAGNVVNLTTTVGFLDQMQYLLLQVRIDIATLDAKFERQIDGMKMDILSLKQDMIAVKQRQDVQQTQGDLRGTELVALKAQMVEVARVTGEMRSEVEGITSKLSFRNRLELWAIAIGGVIGSVIYIYQQVAK